MAGKKDKPTCPVCGGKGEIQDPHMVDESMIKCPECKK